MSPTSYAPSKLDARRKPPGASTLRNLWRRRWLRWLAISGAASVVAIIVLWILVHRVPWMGPLVANTLRAVVGKENVTRLEELVYGIEDEVNQALRKDEQPKARWEVKKQAAPAPKPPEDASVAAVALPPFAPKPPGPVHKSWSAPGDGEWVPIVDPRKPDDEVRMVKTLLHPDRGRSWAELFVVAVDLSRAELHAVAGYQEPKSENPKAENYKRTAKIPEKHQEALLGAFNGGFMTEHGGYGMYIDGLTLVPPKDKACTLAKYKDGALGIGTWTHLKNREPEMLWYRQAPNCMFENNEMHELLRVTNVRRWGATLDGNTVIRRSAVGLNQEGTILYVGISNHTTARVMAEGMHHAGAATVAQMDVNWSYPKFVLYEPRQEDGQLIAVALASGFEFSEGEYLRERSMRDFFYLVRKPLPN